MNSFAPSFRRQGCTLERVSVAHLDPLTMAAFINIAGTIQQSILDRDRVEVANFHGKERLASD
jgi:hypothetical protein